jgi:hypothetical protein
LIVLRAINAIGFFSFMFPKYPEKHMDLYNNSDNGHHETHCASREESPTGGNAANDRHAPPADLSGWAAHEAPAYLDTLMLAMQTEQNIPQHCPPDAVLWVFHREYLNLPATVRAPVRSLQPKRGVKGSPRRR